MEITVTMLAIVCPLTFLAGFVDAIAGGGGLIALPAYLLAGVPPHVAIGTSKLASSVGLLVSTSRFARNGCIIWKYAWRGAVVAFLGSVIGSSISLMVSETIIQGLLIVILPIVAFYVLRNKHLDREKQGEAKPHVMMIVLAVSFVTGAYNGFYGPGTGTFLILLYTGWAGIQIRYAAGCAKVVNMAADLAGFLVFLINGKVVVLLGLCAMGFSMFGSFVGAGMMLKNGNKIVRPLILFVLVLLFVKIVIER